MSTPEQPGKPGDMGETGKPGKMGQNEYASLEGLVVEPAKPTETPKLITEVPSAAELAAAKPQGVISEPKIERDENGGVVAPAAERGGFKVQFKDGTRVALRRSNSEKNQASGIAGRVEYDWKTRLAEPGDIDEETGQMISIAEGYTRVSKTSADGKQVDWKDMKSDDLAAEQPGFQAGEEIALPDRPGERWHIESQSLTGEVKLVRAGGESDALGVQRLSAAELATMLQPESVESAAEPAAPDNAPGPRYYEPEQPRQQPVSPGVFEGRTPLPKVVHGAQAPLGTAPKPPEAPKRSLWQRLSGSK